MLFEPVNSTVKVVKFSNSDLRITCDDMPEIIPSDHQ